MYDPTAINASTDLFDLVSGDTTLCKLTVSEQAGPCPKCGGKDRLHVNTDKNRFFCRQCHPKWGDAIEYVQWRDGVDFVEACELLGGDKSALSAPRIGGTYENRPKPTILRDSEAPSDLWQERAREFVTYCETQLWQIPDALDYLHGRGLSDETIRAARLGYNPKEIHDKPENWGQEPANCPRGVWLPRGWVIPCEVGGVLWYVKVRRPADDSDDGNKYIAVKGSHKAGVIYGLDSMAGKSDGVLCEGELNALILGQCVGGVCGVASVGDSGNIPGAQSLPTLASIKRLWLAYDPDKAGQDGAAKMAGLSGRARVLAWPWGDRGEKYDIADAHRDGENLAVWVFEQIGPADPVACSRWFEYHMQPFLTDPTLTREDPRYKIGRALLNAWDML